MAELCPLFRYVADMSRQRAESILKNEDKEGCFVVRNSSTKGLYTLSLYTKLPHSQVKTVSLARNKKHVGDFSQTTIEKLLKLHKNFLNYFLIFVFFSG